MKRIAIAGGIGSGKSVVSSVLKNMGYPVYDCDKEAKRIMNTCENLKEDICKFFGKEAYICGSLNRQYISDIVFNNPTALEKLNGFVHPYVVRDFTNWSCNKSIAFVESAILFESGLSSAVDEIWLVSAPEDVRIRRVMKRNNISEDSVIKRINSQMNISSDMTDIPIKVILNDDITPILPQILKYLIK